LAQENVAIVEVIYEGYSKGDFGAPVQFFDPQVVFVLSPEFPDAGTYLGTEEIAKYTRGFLEPWEHVTIEAEDLTAAGDSVLAAVRQRGTGNTSGAATEMRYFMIWSFRGNKVIRVENFRDRTEALKAVGLSR
jgi:ketosteroid isomerase-like protein